MGQDAVRKKEVNAAAAQEAKVNAAVTKASRDAEAAKLNEAKKGIKDAEELKLKAAQAAMTGDSTGNVGSAARTSAKEAADNLRRVGGYTGGRNTQADTAAAQAFIAEQGGRALTFEQVDASVVTGLRDANHAHHMH